MVTVVSVDDMVALIHRHGVRQYFRDLLQVLEADFARWSQFHKMPRPAFHVPDGVLELMPIADDTYFAFKYVNGHPKNPLRQKQTVVATGQLSRVDDGYPVLITEMTLLTALRTAATAALATKYLARTNASTLALIGTGAQSEFQVVATALVREIKTVRFYDVNPQAMQRFAHNLRAYPFTLVPCDSAQQAVAGADIITVCTAAKARECVVADEWVVPGVHINGLGGDCPGKTELALRTVARARVVVEFFAQSLVEGEIQQLAPDIARALVYGELWELVTGAKPGRTDDNQITLFDSVGFALEDFSALKLTYQLAERYQLGVQLPMVPVLTDPKDLFSLLSPPHMNDEDTHATL